MDYSFYGGRRGASFILSGRFRYIDGNKIPPKDEKLIEKEYGLDKPIKSRVEWVNKNCMIQAFKQDGDYTEVNYDEYVIIDSYDKNDPNNGKVYRRGYDFNSALGGAEYIGQIVGPSGPAPALKMTTYQDVEDIVEKKGYEYLKSSGEYAPTVNLVPGKYAEDGFNDSIKWICCSIRDEFNQESEAYVGFIFPYTVIEYEAQSVSPYYHRGSSGENFINTDLMTKVDDGKHPFYAKWNVKIPKGIKGDTFKNYRIMIADNTIEPYDGQNDDIENQRQVIVCDYYHYDKDSTGEPITIYIGDYNSIQDISVADNGSLIINYTHDGIKTTDNKIKWITSVSVNTGSKEGEGTQKLVIQYNDGTSKEIGNPINYIMKTAITEDYHLIVLYSDPAYRKKIVAEGKGYEYEGRNDWYDLGDVKSDSGVLIGLNLPLSTFPSLAIDDICAKLNLLYPNGLTGDDLKGKIISVGDAEDTKMMFAFDYGKVNGKYKGWYYLGAINKTSAIKIKMCVIAGNIDNEETEKKAKTMPVGTIWFCIDGNELAPYPIPEDPIVPELYDRLCVLVGRLSDPAAQVISKELRQGSIWFVTQEG